MRIQGVAGWWDVGVVIVMNVTALEQSEFFISFISPYSPALPLSNLLSLSLNHCFLNTNQRELLYVTNLQRAFKPDTELEAGKLNKQNQKHKWWSIRV